MSDYGAPPPPPPPGQPYNFGQPYPGGPYSPQPPLPAPRAGLAARLGERLTRRPEPRFAVALAGTGAALALFGVLLWGGSYFGDATSGDTLSSGSDRRLLGAGLGALLTVVGYVLAVRQRRGALATAGAVGAGVGLPLTLGFLTLDFGNSSGGYPFNSDVVFWISALAWAISYLAVPGTRGRTLFVFLISNGFFAYILSKNTSDLRTQLAVGEGGPTFNGLGTIAAIGLVFGLGYYLVAFLLDRAGRHGPATGLVYAAFGATATGIIAWIPDLHQVGTGIITIIIGAAVCWYGGSFGRRLTCFAAAASIAVGIGVLVADAAPDDGNAAGAAFLVIGLVVVAVAGLVASGLRERDDLDPEAVVRSR